VSSSTPTTMIASDQQAMWRRALLGTRPQHRPYHRRPIVCCILAGDTDGEGLAIVMPVAGLIIGMALRVRVAAGW
jgi:hypothetical protein